MRFTIGTVVLVTQVVVENEVLDALLFFFLGLLLRAHSNCEAGICGDVDVPSLTSC